MADRYWVGGTGTWDAANTTNWSASSGGAGGASVPTTFDAVFFNASSGAGTVTISTGAAASINCTGYTQTWAGTGALTVVGNITLVSGMTVNYTGTITITESGTLTTAGKTIGSLTIGDGDDGYTVTLGDALTASGALILSQGTFNANNYNVTVSSFSSSNANNRTLTMGSGLWTLSGTGTVWNVNTSANLTFNKDTANILLSNTSSSSRTFTGGGRTYNKLTIGGATGTSTTTIGGVNTFSELASTKTVAHTVQISDNQTVTTWSITGTKNNVVTLRTNNNNTGYTITKSGGGFLTGIDYLEVRNVAGIPVSDTWYIGVNSTFTVATPNFSYGMYNTQRANNAVIVLTSTTSTTWTVPADWYPVNTIHLIGGGGGGGGSEYTPASYGGGGGGGGGYTKLSNQSLSIGANITYQCGSGGTGGTAAGGGNTGGTTSWNSGAATAAGGSGGAGGGSTNPVGGSGGVGSTYTGGTGGAGSTRSGGTGSNGGGGGGGAAGPNGNGGNGGNASNTGGAAGGGGGGNGGGANGGNAASGEGGTGGNNVLGYGGGATGNDDGSSGGGSAGLNNDSKPETITGYGIDVLGGIGSGGGGGGGSNGDFLSFGKTTAGLYGGGGGGGGNSGSGRQSGFGGGQGAIIIVYGPGNPTASGNFLMFC